MTAHLDPEPIARLRGKLRALAVELLLARAGHGITTGDLRYAAENRGWLTGHESLAFMNALQLGRLIQSAGGIATGEHRRSQAAAAKRSLNAIYALREFVPVDRREGAA